MGDLRIGHVVMEDGRPENYILVQMDGAKAMLLQIGTVQKSEAPLFGKTLVMPYWRTAPIGVLNRIGYAGVEILENDPEI